MKNKYYLVVLFSMCYLFGYSQDTITQQAIEEAMDTVKYAGDTINSAAEKLYNDGIVSFNEGDYKSAIVSFTAALDSDSVFVKAAYNRGI